MRRIAAGPARAVTAEDEPAAGRAADAERAPANASSQPTDGVTSAATPALGGGADAQAFDPGRERLQEPAAEDAALAIPPIWRRAAFWGGGAVVFLAAAVATLAPAAVGVTGLVLLLGLAGAGALVLYGVASGQAFSARLRPRAKGPEDWRVEETAGAFEALPDPALILDRDGAPRIANAAMRQLSEEAGVLGESARPPGFDRVLGAHPAIAAAVFRLARAARAGERLRERLPTAPFGLDRRSRRFELEVAPLPDGRSLWRARELPLSGGGVEEGQVQPDDLLDDAPIGFFSATPDGRVVYANGTLRDWLGPAANRPDLRVGHFVAGEALRALGRPKPAAGAPVRSEVTLRARDGIAAPALLVTTWPEPDEDTAPAAVYSRSIVYARAGGAAPMGVAQAMAATSTAVTASTMDPMFANAPFGVARLDRGAPEEASVLDANPALLSMTDGAAAPGARFADLFTIDAPEQRERFERAEADAATPIEARLAVKGAAARQSAPFVHLYFAPDARGRLAAYLVDVTVQKELEGQLFHSQKMKAIGTLAGGVAHDMRNMLQAVVGSTYELMRRHPLGDPSYPFLVELEQHVARGQALLRQLLTFARQETVKPEVIDVSAFVADAGVWLRPLVGEKVRVETILGRDVPPVKMGRAQLESALMNLASNARDAMQDQPAGLLEITTRGADHTELADVRLDEVAEGRYAVIAVRDTGSGMNKETLEKVFEPFFTTKEHGDGTGLGLASVFGAARQAGGHVLAESEVGAGTTFRIYVPACSAEEAAAAEAAAERVAAEAAIAAREEETTDLSGVGRILLVEDNQAVRAFTARMLEAQGYEVLQAEDGRDALETVEEYRGELDLVISDVMMPEMDGPTFLAAARDSLGDAPVIFISGYAESEFNNLLGDADYVHFLGKPFKLDQLARRVKVLLAARGADRGSS